MKPYRTPEYRTTAPAASLAALLVLCPGMLHAAIVFATDDNTTGYTASTTDLLQTSFGSRINGADRDGNQGTNLFNGAVPATAGDNSDRYTAGAGQHIYWEFDLTASPGGYDITSIDTYEAWGDRNGQNFNVLISFVNDPTALVTLIDGSTNGPWIAGSGNNTYNMVTFTNNGGGVLDNGSISATGVARIRFDFLDADDGFNMYREIDVIGTAVPEPSTAMLGTLGCIALLRRKK